MELSLCSTIGPLQPDVVSVNVASMIICSNICIHLTKKNSSSNYIRSLNTNQNINFAPLSGDSRETSVPSNDSAAQNNMRQDAGEDIAPAPQLAPPQAAPAGRPAAQPAEGEEDWLSMLHNFVSFLVLFTVIYFYSSIERCIIIFTIVTILIM